MRDSLSKPEPVRQKAFRSVFAVLTNVTNTHTHTHTHAITDRPRYSVCSNKPHLAIAAMRPNNGISVTDEVDCIATWLPGVILTFPREKNPPRWPFVKILWLHVNYSDTSLHPASGSVYCPSAQDGETFVDHVNQCSLYATTNAHLVVPVKQYPTGECVCVCMK